MFMLSTNVTDEVQTVYKKLSQPFIVLSGVNIYLYVITQLNKGLRYGGLWNEITFTVDKCIILLTAK